MSTPIARPMTMPPPYPEESDGGKDSTKSTGHFFPPPAFLEDYKNVLLQIADILGKRKTSGQNVSVEQDEFLNRFTVDNIGDDLLSDDQGWGLSYQILCQEIISLILSVKEIEKTAGKGIVFPFAEIAQVLKIPPETLTALLFSMLELSIAADLKFSDISFDEKNSANIPEKTEQELLVLLKKMIITGVKFYQELGMDWNNLKTVNFDTIKDKISPEALLRFLGRYQKEINDSIPKLSENPGERKSQTDNIYWPKLYKLFHNEVMKELKQTILEATLGKRNLANDLWKKIADQLSNKFIRDLKAEQDLVQIDEIGKQLKSMVSSPMIISSVKP